MHQFKINYKIQFRCFILALVFTVMLNRMVTESQNTFIEKVLDYGIENNEVILYTLFNMLLLLPIIIIHELIHAIFYKIFGGKVIFGIMGLNVYTREISGISISRNKFLIVLLAPVTIISLICMIIHTWICPYIYILSVLGASSDIYMAFSLIKLNSDAKIYDREYGYEAEY